MLQPAAKPAQRFSRILSGALKGGLETTLLKSVLDEALKTGFVLPEGFTIYDPNADGKRPDATTVNLRHLAADNEVDLVQNLLFSNPKETDPLTLTFPKVPAGLDFLFQRMNFKQNPDPQIMGLVCERFTIFEERPEPGPFYIKHQSQRPDSPNGIVHLDWHSKTEKWNPLFLKYRLAVAPALKQKELGYLKVDANFDENQNVTVTIYRVSEKEVPELLKTAPTLPR